MNDWYTVSAVAVAGIILGALFFYFNRMRASRTTLGGDVDLERKDLEAKRDALVLQLRDTSLGEEERARLEAETADALRKLDEHVSVAPAARPSAPMTMNPTMKGFLWGAASVAALAGLGYYVMQQAKPRAEGGSLTGGDDPAPMQQQAPAAMAQQGGPDPMLMQLEQAVQAQPDNLQLRNDLAQAYLERDNLMAVFQQTKIVLEKSPDDSRALTLQGLVRVAMGETEEAMRMLRRAIEKDPKNLDGWVGMAWIHAQAGRLDEAEKMIAEAVRQVPGEKPRLEEVFQQMKPLAASGGQNARGNSLPEGHPPISPDAMAAPAPAMAGAAPATAGSAAPVRVTLDLAASAKQRSGLVFVIVRNPAGGPPIAVKRVMAASFPLNVELTQADSMMGQQLPASFRLEARLDSDGDPLTKPSTDPTGSQENVTPGASVRLALQ